MKIAVHVDTLRGVPLHWAVAQASGTQIAITKSIYGNFELWTAEFKDDPHGSRVIFQPSYSSQQGVDLIERFKINVEFSYEMWVASMPHKTGLSFSYGDRFLLAAMRALVNNKLGDTVECPEELLQ